MKQQENIHSRLFDFNLSFGHYEFSVAGSLSQKKQRITKLKNRETVNRITKGRIRNGI